MHTYNYIFVFAFIVVVTIAVPVRSVLLSMSTVAPVPTCRSLFTVCS